MDQQAVRLLLEANQNEKGIQKWQIRYANRDGLKSFGIGLTVLRRLAKTVGRNHDLALLLWESDYYDERLMALLIDDPKLMTREQAEAQVDDMKQGHLAHVFSSCDAALAKTSFAIDLASDWIQSDSKIRKSCGYGLFYELSKSKKKSMPNDDFFIGVIDYIKENFQHESLAVQGAMGGAMLGIGKRSAILNEVTLELAKTLGPIQFETEGKYCEPLNVVKHLTSDYIKNRLGISATP